MTDQRTDRQVFDGLDWRGSARLPLRAGDSVRFTDARDCDLSGRDLSGVELIGCRLNGASFAGARLSGARLIGCFAADDRAAVDFRSAGLDEAAVLDSHLHALANDRPLAAARWPADVAQAASETLADDPETRYRACQRLRDLGDARAAHVVACLLTDDNWEIRHAALVTLEELWQAGVAHARHALLEFIFQRLGDEHPTVRATTAGMIRSLDPPTEVVLRPLRGMTAQSEREQLAGVRAGIELARRGERFSRFVNRQALERLRQAEQPAVRAAAMHLLGVLDDSRPEIWAQAARDQDASVRLSAVSAAGLLSTPPPVTVLIPLLHDPVERVRLEAVYTLGQLGYRDPADLAPALQDPSAAVRKAAAQLLESRNHDQ